MKHLLVVWHSQGGGTEAMARAVLDGATGADVEGVEARLLRALEAGVQDLLWADAVILGTPENFGYMSGAMKDFLDRTFYPCEGKLEGMPFAIFVCAGNDGSGAVGSIQRIARGFAFREVQAPLVCRGEVTGEILERCRELGLAFAAGLEMGVF